MSFFVLPYSATSAELSSDYTERSVVFAYRTFFNCVGNMDILGKIHSDGNTIVLVTHEEDISAFAHRVVRLRDGLVESDRINENPHKATLESVV